MLAVATRSVRSALVQSRGAASISAFGELPNFSTAQPEALATETRGEGRAATVERAVAHHWSETSRVGTLDVYG